MATITGLTASRMLEIEDATVVNGYIDEAGHLILVTHSGILKDAGPITTFAATTDAAGGVELATILETQQGLDNQRAVTPSGLASLAGYRYLQTVSYTSSGTFKKASYNGIKALRVRLVGGGGAGGAARPATTGAHSSGGGGGGGGYAEAFLLSATIADTENITVGAGGVGTSTAGTAGGSSSFGTFCVAGGGGGGNIASDQNLLVPAIAGAPGTATVGDIRVGGSSGAIGFGYATLGIGGEGGRSHLGGGGSGSGGIANAGAYPGGPGTGYGGGGGGSAQNNDAAGTTIGANGAPGIVLVDVYV